MINNSINTSEVTKSPTAAVRHRRMRAVALGVYLLACASMALSGGIRRCCRPRGL